jgi:hypothetical protein
MIRSDRFHLDGLPHGIQPFGTTVPGLVERLGLQIVLDASPKYLLDNAPALHYPACARIHPRTATAANQIDDLDPA